eukprot:m.139098 g.139098  ORF g.139098 m.139098 type:complete len:277 (+) comp17612_c0_seq1:1348-2178(+)
MVQYSATSIKRFSLELGGVYMCSCVCVFRHLPQRAAHSPLLLLPCVIPGDAPVLVFADCDLEAAVADIVGLKFANAGQICVSPNRVLVEQSIYEQFIALVAEKAKVYTCGAGTDERDAAAVVQPVVSEASLARLLGYVTDAVDRGARVVCGGARIDRPGTFLAPTVLADVHGEMLCTQEELFGPLMTIRPFVSREEAFVAANNTDFGLSGYVYTTSLETMLVAEKSLLCGNVLINGAHYSIELPHGGLKQSGYGKDISHFSMRDYYDVKRITIKRT